MKLSCFPINNFRIQVKRKDLRKIALGLVQVLRNAVSASGQLPRILVVSRASSSALGKESLRTRLEISYKDGRWPMKSLIKATSRYVIYGWTLTTEYTTKKNGTKSSNLIPLFDTQFGSAPYINSTSATSSFPATQASCNGVQPALSRACMFAPECMFLSATPGYPDLAALWRMVSPVCVFVKWNFLPSAIKKQCYHE